MNYKNIQVIYDDLRRNIRKMICRFLLRYVLEHTLERKSTGYKT